MNKLHITLLLAICMCLSLNSSANSGDYSFYGLKTPVKVMRQWSVSFDEAADITGYDLNDYKSVDRAIEDGALDEMTTQIVKYDFDSDGHTDLVAERGANGPSQVALVEYPGVFNVEYKNGKPFRFTLVEGSCDEIPLDSYDVGLDYFTLTYNLDGTVASMTGKTSGFFGNSPYIEKYSEYKFDSKGNWIRRKVETEFFTLLQYRAYEY